MLIIISGCWEASRNLPIWKKNNKKKTTIESNHKTRKLKTKLLIFINPLFFCCVYMQILFVHFSLKYCFLFQFIKMFFIVLNNC